MLQLTPGNRIRPQETIRVTQQTGTSHHNCSSGRVKVLVWCVSLAGRGRCKRTSEIRRNVRQVRGVWGRFTASLSVRQVAV